MSNLHAVIFDLGKVLVDFDYRIAINRLLQRSSITAAELMALVNQSPLLHQYEAGEISTQDFFRQVKSLSGFAGSLAEFGAIFGDIFTPIPAMIALHADLHAKGIPTFIFSNTNELAVQYLREHFTFIGDFDGCILSYEQRLMKPDARIYEVVERVSGHSGEALFYIDDRPENIATALSRGWQALIHQTPAETQAWLRQTGLI